MALFLIETLEDLLKEFCGEFVHPEIFEDAKTTLKLLIVDMSKQENIVYNRKIVFQQKIGVVFSLKYDMQQRKSSCKVTSV